MKTSKKKQSLINEQNKSLILIACVCIIVIAVVGVIIMISNGSPTEAVSSTDDGIVDDMDAIRRK